MKEVKELLEAAREAIDGEVSLNTPGCVLCIQKYNNKTIKEDDFK